MSQSEMEFEQKLKEAKALNFELPPYFNVRMEAKLRAVKKGDFRHRFWQGFALVATMACLFLAYPVLFKQSALMGTVDQEMVLKVGKPEEALTDLAFVEIVLPDGVNFKAQGIPEMAQLRRLTLVWQNAGERRALPFIIQGKQVGEFKILVRYLNAEAKELATREMRIRFKNAQGVIKT